MINYSTDTARSHSEVNSKPFLQSGKDRNVRRYFNIPKGVIVHSSSNFTSEEQETIVLKAKRELLWEYYTSEIVRVNSYGNKILDGKIDIKNLKEVTANDTGRIIALSFNHNKLLTR